MTIAPLPAAKTPRFRIETHSLFGFIRPFRGSAEYPGFVLPVFGDTFTPLMQISNGNGHIEEFARCTFPVAAVFPPRAQFQRSVGDRLLHAFYFPGEAPFAGEELRVDEFLRNRLSDLDSYPAVKLSILRRLQIADGYMEAAEQFAKTMHQRDAVAARSWLLEERQLFEALVKSGELRMGAA